MKRKKMTRQERIKKRQQVTSGLTFNTLSVIVALMWTLNVTALIIGNITVTNLICDKSYSDLQETMEIALEDIDKSALEESIESENWDDSKIQNGFEKMKFVMKRQEISKCFLIIETSDLPSKYHTIYSVVGEDVDDIEKIGKEEFGVEKEALDEAVNDIFRGDLPGAALTKDLYSLSDTPYSMLIGSITNDEGKVIAVYAVMEYMEELPELRERYTFSMMIVTVFMILIGTIIAGTRLKKHTVKPLKNVISETERFVRDNTRPDEDFLKYNSSNIREIVELGTSIEKMENDTINYMENLAATTAERERVASELHLATKIQESMLPSEFPPFPERNEFDIFASMVPAKEVGGDFYDFFLIDEDHLGLVIADVSGKGIPAALFMAISKNIIKNYAMMGLSPKEVMEMSNKSICEISNDGMFVTAWFGILTISTGHVVASNAGHEYPMIKKAQEGFSMLKDKHCFVLGGMDGVPYSQYEFDLEKGDSLFVYTDGLAEANDILGEMFGTDRIVNELNRQEYSDAEALIENMQKSADAFMGEAEQFDDLTMLVVTLT